MSARHNITPASTVVIPCYNDSGRLEACLASLVGQTDRDWEAIVIDDGSTEGDVAAVVLGVADPRVRSVRLERNRGLAAARNTGFRAARALFVLPVDSDDRLAPDCLQRLTAVLRDDPGADCVFPDFRLFGAIDGIRRFVVGDMPGLLVRQWLPGPGCLIRRTLWERVGGYCEDPVLRAGNEDWEFYVAASEEGFVARHVAEPLYEYRVSPSSMSTRLQYVNHLTREVIHARHRSLYARHGRRRQFLAEGYRAGAQASAARNERRRSLRLALHGLRLEPVSRSGLRLILRALTPEAVLSVMRRVRAMRSAQR